MPATGEASTGAPARTASCARAPARRSRPECCGASREGGAAPSWPAANSPPGYFCQKKAGRAGWRRLAGSAAGSAAPAPPERAQVDRGDGDAERDHPEAEHRQEAEQAEDDQQQPEQGAQPARHAQAHPGPEAAQPPAKALAEALAGFAADGRQLSMASRSSIIPAIMPSPLSQKHGSEASSPKGASSSLWCFEPPAFSMSKYLSWKPGAPSA